MAEGLFLIGDGKQSALHLRHIHFWPSDFGLFDSPSGATFAVANMSYVFGKAHQRGSRSALFGAPPPSPKYRAHAHLVHACCRM